jgi:hypothetical protein
MFAATTPDNRGRYFSIFALTEPERGIDAKKIF